MFSAGQIVIPPEYQRQFVWQEARESQLVESVMLGIPIPNLFMATNNDSTWEVVDGVQRISSLSHFLGSAELLRLVGKSESLRVSELEKLSTLNGLTYKDVPSSIQLLFNTRFVRVTVLNDKSDLSVRFDLFERLNTGGVSLTNQEIRNCIYRGPFNDGLKELASDANFLKVAKFKDSDKKNGTPEEFVLRFFAYLNRYKEFDHSVKDFLNDYMGENSNKSIPPKDLAIFKKTFSMLATHLPDGVVRNRSVTPVNLYEAISVGAALALRAKKNPTARKVKTLLGDKKLAAVTTGATNNRKAVTGRIEYVRDAL